MTILLIIFVILPTMLYFLYGTKPKYIPTDILIKTWEGDVPDVVIDEVTSVLILIGDNEEFIWRRVYALAKQMPNIKNTHFPQRSVLNALYILERSGIIDIITSDYASCRELNTIFRLSEVFKQTNQ